MQLYALDKTGSCIFSKNAFKKTDYFCLECGGPLRLREGEVRQPHFYHLSSSLKRPCRQSGKSLKHLQVQLRIESELPPGEAALECHFDSIGRIADVAWHSQKLIFEIQCSPMLKEEMLTRVADYEKVGYRVVWILHDKRYNQWRLSALEKALAPLPHYFTNIDGNGEGMIYDQWSSVERGIRRKTLSRLPIDVSKPYFAKARLGFEGDLASLPEEDPYRTKIKAFAIKKAPFSLLSWIKNTWKTVITLLLKPYCSS